MVRFRLLGLFLLCLITSPILLTAMFLQALLGAEDRVMAILIAYNRVGNYACGEHRDKTVSGQVGRSAYKGNLIAKLMEIVIDFLLGKNHCREVAEVEYNLYEEN